MARSRYARSSVTCVHADVISVVFFVVTGAAVIFVFAVLVTPIVDFILQDVPIV